MTTRQFVMARPQRIVIRLWPSHNEPAYLLWFSHNDCPDRLWLNHNGVVAKP